MIPCLWCRDVSAADQLQRYEDMEEFGFRDERWDIYYHDVRIRSLIVPVPLMTAVSASYMLAFRMLLLQIEYVDRSIRDCLS